MNNGNIGINVNGIKKLSLEMLDYKEEFNKIFNELNFVIRGTNQCLQGEMGDKLRKSYENFSSYFALISKNMQKYSDDFTEAIKKYQTYDMNNQMFLRK